MITCLFVVADGKERKYRALPSPPPAEKGYTMRVNDALGMLDQVLQEESESTLNLFLDHCGCGTPCESFSILNNGTWFFKKKWVRFVDAIRFDCFRRDVQVIVLLLYERWQVRQFRCGLTTQHHEAAAARKNRLVRLSKVFNEQCCWWNSEAQVVLSNFRLQYARIS